MSPCTEPRFEEMLHDYEIGLLEGDDKRQFEMHLYDCEHCLAEIQEFSEEARMMRQDADVRNAVEHLAADESTAAAPDVAQQVITPKSKPAWFFRSLAMAAVLIAVAIPVYRYVMVSDGPEQPVQTLRLLPVRDGTANILSLAPEGTVEIQFALGAARSRGDYDVTITEATGDTVVIERGYSDFTDSGQGTLLVPIAKFGEGHYFLTIGSPGGGMVAQYGFRAE